MFTGLVNRFKVFGSHAFGSCICFEYDALDSSVTIGRKVDLVFENPDEIRAVAAAKKGGRQGETIRLVVRVSSVRGGQNRNGHAVLRCSSLKALRRHSATDAATTAAKKTNARIPKSRRFEIFADWLVEKFGLSHLSSGSGVLDVAGGGGALSQALLARGVTRVTLIEPNARQRATRHGDTPRSEDELRRLRASAGFVHLVRPFDSELWESPEFGELLKGASCVVGLHPDEATDSIVEFATDFQKSFAVVPCCVFPSIFTERKQFWRDGKDKTGAEGLVRTTSTLVRWLLEVARRKDASVGRAQLQMEGKNVVVYGFGGVCGACGVAPSPQQS